MRLPRCDSSRAANAINELIHANHTSITVSEQHQYEALQALVQHSMAIQRMGIQLDLLVSQRSHERFSDFGAVQHDITPGAGNYDKNHFENGTEQATLSAMRTTGGRGGHVMGGDITTSTVTISLNSQKKKCNKNCTCLCHSRKHISSPRSLRDLSQTFRSNMLPFLSQRISDTVLLADDNHHLSPKSNTRSQAGSFTAWSSQLSPYKAQMLTSSQSRHLA